MNAVLDRARIESAVQRYDLWLDVRGVPRSRRRALRSELRANLRDAATHQGAGSALRGIGSPRALAHEVAHDLEEAFGTRPRWTVGSYLALAVFAVLMVLWLTAVLGFVDGVQASGVTGREVSGSVFPWGGAVSVEVGADGADGAGLSAGASMPWGIWVAVAIAFVAGARPWRAVRPH